MAEDLIRYDRLAQKALRGVIREVLESVRATGLPGEHHLYIAFRTDFPGVQISRRLRDTYPQEMTIVLQHQFWGLEVEDDRFQVELSFGNVSEPLVIPYAAVKGFFDPSVQFGLQFDDVEAMQGASTETAGRVHVTPQVEGMAAQGANQENAGEAGAGDGAVVSLDAFRKKS